MTNRVKWHEEKDAGARMKLGVGVVPGDVTFCRVVQSVFSEEVAFR